MQIFLTTKFGNHVTPEGGREIRNDPEYIRQSVNESLKRLKTDYIDLLYWYVASIKAQLCYVDSTTDHLIPATDSMVKSLSRSLFRP